MDLINELVRNPAKINRIGKAKAHYCDCGTITWDERCRKCARKYRREFKKLQERYAAERKAK